MSEPGLNEGGLRPAGLRFLSSLGVGSFTHIETQEANDDSSIDFTETFTEEYDRYVVYLDNVILESADSEWIAVRMSSDGGSTWDSGGSDYAWAKARVRSDGSADSGGSGGDDSIRLNWHNPGNEPQNNDTLGMSILVSDPIDGNRATVLRESSSLRRDQSNPEYATEFGGGIRLEAKTVDSIQFGTSSGNISSGIFSVYGVDK